METDVIIRKDFKIFLLKQQIRRLKTELATVVTHMRDMRRESTVGKILRELIEEDGK